MTLHQGERPKAQAPKTETLNNEHPETGTPGHDPRYPNERHLKDAVAAGTVEEFDTPPQHRDMPPATPENIVNPAPGRQSAINKLGKWANKHPFLFGGTVAAAATAASVAQVGAFYAATTLGLNHSIGSNPTDGSDRYASAPQVAGGETYEAPVVDYSDIDPATFPHEEFKELPYGVQLDKCIPLFEKAFENGAVDKYAAAAKADNGYAMRGGVGTGSIDDDAQELLNRMTVKMHIALTEPNINTARNMAACVYEPGTNIYENFIDMIGNGNPGSPTTFAAFENTPVFTQGNFAGNEANGQPTRVLSSGNLLDGWAYNIVFQEQASHSDPSVKEVVVVDSIAPDDPGYVEDISTWNP